MATNIPELKAECTRHGVTLEELASRIGVNNATLYRKMTGKSEFYRNELQVIRDVLCLNDEKFLLIFLTINLQKCKKNSQLTKWRWWEEGDEMKLELSYDEVSTIRRALLLKAEEAANGARECAKLGDMDNDVKFWQERAENYKKVYEAVVAQREQADKEYEQADAEVKEE